MHYDNGYAYLCMKDGYVTSVCVHIDEVKTVNLEIGEMIFKSEGIAYNGLVTSPNRVIWAVLET